MMDNTPIHGCSGCATTGGRMACANHGPQAARVASRSQLQAWTDGLQLCALGHHAWTPWLGLPEDNPSRYVTFCVRCRHEEQYDL